MVSSSAAPSASSTRAVERALGLLTQVCAEGAISLTDCARRVDLPTSTALRLLRTLETADFVARDQRGFFRAGARLTQLGAAAWVGRPGRHGGAVPAAHRGGDRRVGLRQRARSRGHGAVRRDGRGHALGPAHRLGRPHRRARRAPRSAARCAAGWPCAGYVAKRSTVEPDVTAVAAPIWRPGGIAGPLSLVGPTYRIDDEKLSSSVASCAARPQPSRPTVRQLRVGGRMTATRRGIA